MRVHDRQESFKNKFYMNQEETSAHLEALGIVHTGWDLKRVKGLDRRTVEEHGVCGDIQKYLQKAVWSK